MTTVDEMRVVMDAETARLFRKLNDADRRMAQFQRDVQRRLKSMDTYFASFGTAAGLLGGALGTRQVVEYANAWTRTERALSANQDIFGMRLHSAQELTKFASQARVGLEEYATTYYRTAAAIRDYGMGAETAAKVTSTLSMALKLGGATAEEQASVLLQFSQALNKGKLDGDEFRTVMEAAPVVIELLATRMKASKGEIINWAREGKLQVKDLVGAMVDGGAQVERIFRRMPQTVDESLTVLRNAVIQYVGERDKMLGGTQQLVGLISGISNNIDTIGDSALVMGAGLLAAFSPALITRVGMFAVGMAASAGPLGIILGLLGAGAAAVELFGDKVAMSGDGLVNLKDTARATIDVLGNYMAPVLDAVGRAWQHAVDLIQGALSGLPISFDDILSAGKRAANALIGAYVFAARAMGIAFTTLPRFIGQQMIEMANFVLEKVEMLVADIVTTLNKLPGINIKFDSVHLLTAQIDKLNQEIKTLETYWTGFPGGEFLNRLNAGNIERKRQEIERLRVEIEKIQNDPDARTSAWRLGDIPGATWDDAKKAFADAGKDAGRDFIGEAAAAIGTGLSTLGAEIAARAREIADLRREMDREARRAKAFTDQSFVPKRGKPPADQKLIDAQKKAAEKVEDVYQHMLRETERHRELVVSEYEQELRKFKDMLDKKLITQQQFDDTRVNLAVIAAKKMNEAVEKEFHRLRDITDTLASNMENAFSEFTDNGTFSFREFTRSVLADMAKLVFKMMVLKPLFGESGKGFGLLGDALGFGSLTSMGSGVSGGGAAPKAFAGGGRPPVGVPSIVGENGKELFIPDVAGRIVPNSALMAVSPPAGAAGGSPISVNIDARGATPDAVKMLEARIPTIAVRAVTDAFQRSGRMK